MDPSPPTFWSGLRWADVVAIVGALAWLPYIIRLFLKPRVTIIPGGTIEIGFTGLGPIVNPSLAFRTEHKDALVAAIEFDVAHQRGQRATFRAVQLHETGAMTQSTSGESAVHQRTQSTVAIVLTPASIAERKVVCQEREHLATYQQRLVAYQAAVRRVQNNDAERWLADAMASPECHALRDFWTGEFFWQPGRYTVTARAKVAELSTEATTSFAFELTDAQIQLLRSNQVGLEWELVRIARAAGVPNINGPETFKWHWEYSTSSQ
ncbi:MAG: hypothetical protein U1F39_06720 [Steroidobacteraceae bacterium]